MKNIKRLRRKIDKIDDDILGLLNDRAAVTLEIGKSKKKSLKPTFAPDRESQVYKRLLSSNKGLLPDDNIKAIYNEIMSGSLSLQSPPKIAFLGPEATFTHIAALRKFGRSVDYIESDSILDVFTEVERERADYGVVPIENSTEGAVNHTLDMFIDSDLKICSESYLRIEHNLMSKGTKLSSIKKVFSHHQVFAQCRKWLEANLPHADLVPVASTTAAAKRSATYKNSAAIASKLAAQENGLSILARSIEDSSHNITRFLVIGAHEAEPVKDNKTSIVFSMKDKAGALHDVLSAFKRDKVNLTKIESRPSKRKAWKYYFFVDMQGHIKEKRIKRSLTLIKKHCNFFKVLGSYPAA
ncbi:prephenate dehydratase [Candidatus Omnitrophota bacterium]